MFWEHRDWEELPENELQPAVELVRSGLDQRDGAVFRAPKEIDRKPRLDELVVRAARVRRLTFLPGHWLYELQLSLDEPTRERYEWARAYAVVAPASDAPPAGLPEPPHRPAEGTRPRAVVTLIDWQSSTIFNLIERGKMRLDPAGLFDRERSIEYLDFFVSFIASDTGAPFLLLRGGTMSRPRGLGRRDSLPPFEREITERVLKREYLRPPRAPGFVEDGSQPDEPDLLPLIAAPPGGSGVEPKAPPSTPAAATRDKATRGDNSPPSSPPIDQAIGDVEVDAGGAKDPRALRLAGTVLHEGALFRSIFEVHSGDGFMTTVTMVEDTPMGEADAGLLQHRVDVLARSGPRLLLLQRPREEISARELLDRLQGRAGKAPVNNLRIWGDVDLSHVALDEAVELTDVEFLGNVLLKDSHRAGSLTLRKCKFARSIEARNLSIDGDLVLDHSKVLGATPKGDELLPAICLDGARIAGSLQAQRLEVDGQISACNAEIKGTLNLKGIDGRGRRDERSRRWEEGGLLLRSSRLGAGVDLSVFDDGPPEARRRIRSRLEGMVDLTGVDTAGIDLSGGLFGALDLSYARITGLLDMRLCFADPMRKPEQEIGARMFRTRVAGDLIARYAKASEIFMSGAHVGGELQLLGVSLAGSLFAGPQPLQGFRTRVGRDVCLSGAHIGGDCDFNGAKVEGAFEIRTGAIERLNLSLYPVVARGEKAAELDYFTTEVRSLEVASVTGLKAIRLVGISVGSRPDELSPLRLTHLQVQGDVRFSWSADQQAQFDKLRDQVGEGARVRREISWGTCAATVDGDIDMRRIITSGFIELTNLRVGGRVKMADAHVGTDLSARSSWRGGGSRLELSCNGLELESARIDGDAFLSGLVLTQGSDVRRSGRFNGRGMRVGGRLELYHDEDHYARLAGELDLTGARAAELTISGHNFLDKTRPPVLRRAELGMLDIHDPIPGLDLGGVLVKEWGLGSAGTGDIERQRAGKRQIGVKRQIDILSAMLDFDQTVWTTVETQLRNASRSADADRLYRAMKSQERGKTRGKRKKAPAKQEEARGKREEAIEGASEKLARLLGAVATFFSRWLFGYGTNVWPALVIALSLFVALLVALSNAPNVKASDGLLAQINAQCGVLKDKPVTVPARCGKVVQAAASTTTSIQLSPLDLADDYDFADALRLTARYAIPFIGAFGDAPWLPMEKKTKMFPVVPPSWFATFVLITNTMLLSFAAGFVTKRWLR